MLIVYSYSAAVFPAILSSVVNIGGLIQWGYWINEFVLYWEVVYLGDMPENPERAAFALLGVRLFRLWVDAIY